MKKKKLYQFHELSKYAQSDAAFEINQKDILLFDEEDIHQEIVKLVDDVVEEVTGKRNSGVQWEDLYQHVSIEKIDITIPEKLAVERLTDDIRKRYETLKKLNHAVISVSYEYGNYSVWFQIPESDYKADDHCVKEWLTYIRKYNEEVNADKEKRADFEKRYREHRLKDRLISNEMVLKYFLYNEVDDIACDICEEVEEAYEKACRDVLYRIQMVILKRLRYYDSIDSILDALKNGDLPNYRYFVDGTVIQDGDADLFDCDGCVGEREFDELAYTESNGEKRVICEDCSEEEKLKIKEVEKAI